LSDNLKRAAAEAAIELVADGMVLGLGTGSTAEHFLVLLGERIRQGLNVRGVATSRQTERSAAALGIPLTSLDEAPRLDLTVDGADEIDSALRLIKGGGGALLREKIVAAASRIMVVIADESKLVSVLGRFPLPIEIVPFGAKATVAHVAHAFRELGLAPMEHGMAHGRGGLRAGAGGQGHFVTDNGNLILDWPCGRIRDPEILTGVLKAIPGVVEHGLFIGLAHLALIGTAQGVKRLEPANPVVL
jgi:ribose 5-phosphate isomerase A